MISELRVNQRNKEKPDPKGKYVLYRLQIHRRFQWNHALEYAVNRANEHDKPLLIYEGLRCDYPWASDRFHRFIMESMQELQEEAAGRVQYIPFIEYEPGEEPAFYETLASEAVEVISDEYPVFIMREQNNRTAKECGVRYTTVDANGIIPLEATEKAAYNAYFFRKIVQRTFPDFYRAAPDNDPLSNLGNRESLDLPDKIRDGAERSRNDLEDISKCISRLPIDHEVEPVASPGTRKAAIEEFEDFIEHRLDRYHEEANQPDNSAASNMSPWLHFGKISPFEITRRVFEQQPGKWSLDDLVDQNGSRGSYFSDDPNIESYLDEVITWREVGFHFAWHEEEIDTFESLPDWVRETLNEHRSDTRPYVYTLEEFEQAETHDEIWNAAQRQLRREGVIHNYLRMLWGKKILEWTPDPETALAYMIELNNKYAVDGRDPNSYSGIFWCLGRFDRPWPERKIYGKVRYMSSDSTRKKCRLSGYLQRYDSLSQ